MNRRYSFFFTRILILSLLATAATQAQQPKVSEPDAPATAARPATQAPAASGVPHEIKFSAVLKDSSGKPLTGTVAVTFALYDRQEGGTPSWSETQNVEPDAQGRYSVLLGAASSAGVPAELFRSSEGRWLGVRVLAPGQPEQSRVRWVSVPYALKAADAETLGGRPASAYVVAVDPASSPADFAPVPAQIGGSGTPGAISKFTAPMTIGNSVFFENSGKIGLGNTTPSANLDVTGTISASGTVTSHGNLALPNTSSRFVGVLTLGGNRFVHNFGTNNTFIGSSAGNMITTGTGANTAVGASALAAIQTGTSNSAFGSSALFSNTKGFSNAAFGSSALLSNSTGSNNTAFGDSALKTNTVGPENNAFGVRALQANTVGDHNSAFGYQALLNNTTGYSNSAFGDDALGGNTVGFSNSAFGIASLNANTTGFFNSAFGEFALSNNNTGDHNSAFGRIALNNNTSGVQNSGFGAFALDVNKTGNRNAAFGYGALLNGSGDGNIAIGANAGLNLTSGSNNIYIGSDSGASSESNTIRIGTGQTATFVAGVFKQTIASGTAVFINSSGQLGTITSSQRFKNDIADMAGESDLLMRLRPVAFYYKPELDDTHTRQYGLVAEEVAKIAPQLVVFDKDGAPQTVRYHFVNAMLLNEVQKQRQLVESQRNAIEQQKSTILEQRAELQDLAARLLKLESLLAPAQ